MFNRVFNLLLTIGLCCLATETLVGQIQSAHSYSENFETAETSLEMHRPDAHRFELITHTRTTNEKYSGNSSEFLRYWLSPGSEYYFRYSIVDTHLIRDFAPSAWVKATRPGIQLVARVVLPNTKDPNANRPMTALLRGPTYEKTGQWQRLTFTDLEESAVDLLAQQAIILGRKYEMTVNTRGAFVDAIFFNMYTAPGETLAWIDDLTIEGAAPIRADQKQPDERIRLVTNIEEATDSKDVFIKGKSIYANGRPFYPRVIRHRGESFAALKQLGFNTVLMGATPRTAELIKAQELGLWLICPPPASFPADEPSKYRSVLAWSLGNHLTARDLEIGRQKVMSLRRTDPLDRPVICSAISHLSKFSLFCDAIIVELEPIGTTFDLNSIATWIARRKKIVNHELPIWMQVQTEYSESLEKQVAVFDGSSSFLPVDYLQLRHLVWAIISQADGLCFHSRRSLESADPMSQFRAKTLKWINAQLLQVEPWLASGRFGDSLTTNPPDVKAKVIETDRSKLIVIYDKWKPFNELNLNVAKSIMVEDEHISSSSRAFRITANGFEPLVHHRNHGGLTLRLDNFQETAAVVITSDATTISYLNENSRRHEFNLIQQHVDLCSAYLALINHTLAELSQMGKRSTESLALVDNVVANLAQAQDLYRKKHYAGAIASLERADRFLRKAWQPRQVALAQQFSSSTASPLTQHFATLPAHYRLVERMKGGKWSENLLLAGDFESLARLRETGWRQVRNPVHETQSDILLTDDSPIAGEATLHLRAWRTSNQSKRDLYFDSSPAWVVSAPVRAKAGQIIRAHGWVRVKRSVSGSLDGFMLIDSIGGPLMANRYLDKDNWQEFSIYRVATENQPFTLTFLLTGMGEVQVDEVSVRVFELPEKTKHSNVGFKDE